MGRVGPSVDAPDPLGETSAEFFLIADNRTLATRERSNTRCECSTFSVAPIPTVSPWHIHAEFSEDRIAQVRVQLDAGASAVCRILYTFIEGKMTNSP